MRSFQVCCGVSGRFGSYQPGQLLVSEDSEIPMHAIRRASAGAIPLRGDIGASLRGDKSDGRSKCSSTTSPLSAFFVAVAVSDSVSTCVLGLAMGAIVSGSFRSGPVDVVIGLLLFVCATFRSSCFVSKPVPVDDTEEDEVGDDDCALKRLSSDTS